MRRLGQIGTGRGSSLGWLLHLRAVSGRPRAVRPVARSASDSTTGRARNKSARGLAHSRTLRKAWGVGPRASVMECGGPPPLFGLSTARLHAFCRVRSSSGLCSGVVARARRSPDRLPSPAAGRGKLSHRSTLPRAGSSSPGNWLPCFWIVSPSARLSCLMLRHGGGRLPPLPAPTCDCCQGRGCRT